MVVWTVKYSWEWFRSGWRTLTLVTWSSVGTNSSRHPPCVTHPSPLNHWVPRLRSLKCPPGRRWGIWWRVLCVCRHRGRLPSCALLDIWTVWMKTEIMCDVNGAHAPGLKPNNDNSGYQKQGVFADASVGLVRKVFGDASYDVTNCWASVRLRALQESYLRTEVCTSETEECEGFYLSYRR